MALVLSCPLPPALPLFNTAGTLCIHSPAFVCILNYTQTYRNIYIIYVCIYSCICMAYGVQLFVPSFVCMYKRISFHFFRSASWLLLSASFVRFSYLLIVARLSLCLSPTAHALNTYFCHPYLARAVASPTLTLSEPHCSAQLIVPVANCMSLRTCYDCQLDRFPARLHTCVWLYTLL